MPKPVTIKETLAQAVQSVKQNFRFWMLFTQLVFMASMGVLLLHNLMLHFTGGSALLLVFFILAPLYAGLYSSALRIYQGKFQIQQMLLGFGPIWRVIGLSALQQCINIIILFPFYMMVSVYLIRELGWQPEQFQSLSDYSQEQVNAMSQALQDNWMIVISLLLPAWPFILYVQSRYFVAYFLLIEKKLSMLDSLKQAWQITRSGQMRRWALVVLAEICFPVLILLFVVSYPLKYAIYALLLKELGLDTSNTPVSSSNSPIPGNTGSRIRNPYLND